ncbi:MAG: F0F1 ATP synthase subunit B [Bacteroidales bacterium]|nr:F0F1 ATP synthase subunit B [Bacteroidales bacterium]
MNNPLINPGIGVFFWMLISFGILVFILLKWGWPAVIKTLKEREVAINDALEAAEKAREELTRLSSKNDDELKRAKQERDEILRDARLAKDKIIEDAKLKATEEADRIVESARENINYEKQKAMTELKNQIANLSIDIAEKILKQELANKEMASKLVIDELEHTHLN